MDRPVRDERVLRGVAEAIWSVTNQYHFGPQYKTPMAIHMEMARAALDKFDAIRKERS